MSDKNDALICIIQEGMYRHPIYYNKNNSPELLEYCLIEELDEALNKYSHIYSTTNVFLEGNRKFMAGIREIILHNNIAKYGNNTLNIKITGDK